ncbi:hypothetical protein D6D00_00820 [Aureobasidium pullulans]|nr:hypothetical protein D6D00_00820 [Aureobasidium pullulans]
MPTLDAQRVTTSGTTQTYSLVAKMPVPKPLHHDAEERSSSYQLEREMAAAAEVTTISELLINQLGPDADNTPIRFTDALNRKFILPWSLIRSWKGMKTSVRRAFVNIEHIGPHVANGCYNLLNPYNEIILPSAWEMVIQPGWNIKMELWPLPDSITEKINTVSDISPPEIVPTIVGAPENRSQDKSSETLVSVFANDDSSDDPIVEVFIHSDDSYGRSCHTKNKVRKQSSPFSEWMLGGIRPRARPRKHKHLSRSRGVRKTNKRSEMVDGVADDVLGSDDSQSQSSGWLTEYDEGSSGHEPLENISVKRFSGRTSPTDMTPQFNSSPPILPQRRSSDSGLCLEQGSFAVLDEPDSTSTGGSSEVIDNDASKRFESIENIIPPSTADISGSLLRNWFVPKDGINRQVISANIQRYLGNDATVRPGQDRVDGSEEMINDLQKASTIWDEEQRTGRRGAYEDSHAYRQATNAVSDDNEIYRASTSSPQLDSVYLPPGGCVPHHVAQRVAVPDMASTLYEDPRTRIYSLPLHSGALVSTASGDPSIYASTLPVPMPRYDQYGRRESFLTLRSQPYINIMPAIAYGPPTPIPDQSYTRPAPSVDSSYGRERQSASPNVDRNALRRKVDATFAKRSGRDESHPRPRLSPPWTIIDPKLDNDTATNTSGLVTVEDLLRRWTHLNPDSVDSAADLGN